MFLVETDVELGVAAVLLGPPGSDADWLAYARARDELNRRVGLGPRPVLVQLLRSAAVPSATMRRELAGLRGRIRSNVVNVVVSASAIIRHVQTALDWYHKPHYHSSTHATVASAFAHLERALGGPAEAARLAALRRLVASLEARAAR